MTPAFGPARWIAQLAHFASSLRLSHYRNRGYDGSATSVYLRQPKFLRSFPLACGFSFAVAVLPDGDGTLLVCGDGCLGAFTAEGLFLREFAPQGNGNGHVSYPHGLGIDKRNGEVFVTDVRNRVQVFKLDGTLVRAWGRSGQLTGQFQNPLVSQFTTNTTGEALVFVADCGNHRVQVFKRDGTFVRKWGKEGSLNGDFNGPSGVVVTAAAQVVVSDFYNHRLQVALSIALWDAYTSP